MPKPFKVLVIGPAWVGDMVMAQSLFISLKQRYPGIQIDVAAPAWTLALLSKMPEVTNAIALPFKRGKLELRKRLQFAGQLRDSAYGQAILLPNTWKSALIPWLAKIPVRTGFIGECRWGLLNDIRRLDKQRLTMTVQRFIELGQPENHSHTRRNLLNASLYPKLHVTQAQQKRVIDKFTLQLNTKILALCPGAEYGPAKQWPAEYYAEVARQHLSQGKQVWLFGSPKDQAIAAAINQLTGHACLDLTGRTTLEEAVDLMSLVDAVVSNDSGLMHVAAGLDKPLVAIYGSSDPGFTPPLHTQAKILSLQLPCSPCFKRVCPLEHTHCLIQLRPDKVMTALEAITF